MAFAGDEPHGSLSKADYPPVDIVVAMRAAIAARTQRREVDLGIRTFLIDVLMDAGGIVRGDGYDIAPQRARRVTWWSA